MDKDKDKDKDNIIPKSKTRGFEESPQFSLFDQPPRIGSNVARSNSIYKLDITSRELWGDDDAAFVPFDLLKCYSIERKEHSEFFDEDVPFFAVRAPKGTGKTTMVRLLVEELSKKEKTCSILKYDSQISPSLEADASLSDWIVAWKKSISEAVLSALAEQEHFVFDPDMITVIESAEARGERKKNFVGLFREYFSIPHVKDKTDQENKNTEAILNRISKKKDHSIWVFLDEVDQFFSDDKKSINKVGAMLLASRELTGYIHNLNIRITIKPNVFAILENTIDSIANLREFVFNLEWDNPQIRTMLARRIESFIERTVETRFDEKLIHGEYQSEREEWLISQVFYTQEFDLGKGNRPPHEILSKLADKRPRWILSLCKKSAKTAKNRGYEIVHFKHVKFALKEFGNNTISDICSEYRSQCKQLPKVLHRFNGAPTRFEGYAHLVNYIRELITSRIDIEIQGIAEKASAQEVANFLYYIGFLDASKDISNKTKSHTHADDRPELMNAQFNDIYDDLYWEIRPTFRAHLNIGRARNENIKKNRRGNPPRTRE
ncbi:MAG: AAA family ATPase [Pseudomonadales bacterium]|nr:AAA family ATPase [Pseudomonadales bacterium]